MKLTNKELIRMKKETHLFKEGFYNPEIKEWKISKLNRDEEYRNEITRKHPYLNPFSPEDANMIWFREKFPEFFEEELKK